MKKVELGQSPLDFILQNTGTIENLMDFLQLNKISYDQFYNNNLYDISNLNINLSYNEIKRNGITISSPKLINSNNFNNDFNNDFN